MMWKQPMPSKLGGFAVVIGAGSGIGRDCIQAFAAAGVAGVQAIDINVEAANTAAEDSKEVATDIAYQAFGSSADVTKEEDLQVVLEEAVKKFGRIDYAVNSAGIGVKSANEIADADVAEFDRFLNVNVKGTLLFAKIVSKIMKNQESRTVPGRKSPRDLGRGAIINIGSLNSYVPVPGIVQYTAAKHALLGITKSAAIDNAPYNIRVNAICPSWVKTPMVEAAFEGSAELRDMAQKAIPMKRLALEEEISDLVVFLSGTGGSYVTGQGWIVDGGTSLQMRT